VQQGLVQVDGTTVSQLQLGEGPVGQQLVDEQQQQPVVKTEVLFLQQQFPLLRMIVSHLFLQQDDPVVKTDFEEQQEDIFYDFKIFFI
jgi:hypothetical protein